MSFLIATPAYGSQVSLPYFNSCLELREELVREGVAHNWLMTGNESLITRARNTMTATFMNTPYESLLFIDADIEFTPEDVAKLWNMDADVAVAAYPMKRLDAPLSAWRDNELVEITNETEPFPVQYAGTGFMMIKRRVIKQMQAAYPELKHEEGHVGQCWALFDTMVWNDTFLSEDYAFCQRWRDIGGEIICDPTIKLKHWGNFVYVSKHGT